MEREKELGLLRQRWEQAAQGRGQVVFLHGEAGIGKSRLVEALHEHVIQDAAMGLKLHCTAMTQQSAFYPVIASLEQHLQWDSDTPADAKLNCLETELAACSLPLTEAVPFVAPLFSVPLDGRYMPIPLPPDMQRQKALATLTKWLLQGVVYTPGLMVWEDVHWADHATLALLSLLLEQTPAIPILVLLMFRPPFQPPWPLCSYVTQLALDRLDPDGVVQMIDYETAGMPLPRGGVQAIVNKSDGVPLFVEELTKLILEAKADHHDNGDGARSKPVADLTIPNTLQDLLMARLDRLGSDLSLLQWGSMLGRASPMTCCKR